MNNPFHSLVTSVLFIVIKSMKLLFSYFLVRWLMDELFCVKVRVLTGGLNFISARKEISGIHG